MGDKANVITQIISSILSDIGLVIVFHRHTDMDLAGLVCNYSLIYPQGVIAIKDDPRILYDFCSFITGIHLPDTDVIGQYRQAWLKCCRDSSVATSSCSDEHIFAAPQMMLAFSVSALKLPMLADLLPSGIITRRIKNSIAKARRPASCVRPCTPQQVQIVVRWAIEFNLGLTIIGGSHSDHYVLPGVIALDMSAFNLLDLMNVEQAEVGSPSKRPRLLVAGAGSTNGAAVEMMTSHGITIRMGSRPSVGIGSWLQGGLGHLTRCHGLTCDSIVGALVVSVSTGQLLRIGKVPELDGWEDATRPANEADLLWSLRGAGTSAFIVLYVVLALIPAVSLDVWKWRLPQESSFAAMDSLGRFDQPLVTRLSKPYSADAYLYEDDGKTWMGIVMFRDTQMMKPDVSPDVSPGLALARKEFGEENSYAKASGLSLFDQDLYCADMHGGHQGGKTSSFKRCLFFKDAGDEPLAQALHEAFLTRPTIMCYFHFLHAEPPPQSDALGSAFGMRDWKFACIITGVWPRTQDGQAIAAHVIRWVHRAALTLAPLAVGVYNADLGPSLEDDKLASFAFGNQERRRLRQLKKSHDPHDVLRFSCPLPTTDIPLILLISGENGVGKDYCAVRWVSLLGREQVKARAVSISDAIKREFAREQGVDLQRLLHDRSYKEQNRPALTAFWTDRKCRAPDLPRRHFLEAVEANLNVDVLFITGIRDEAPVASLADLTPASRLIEIRVVAEGTVGEGQQFQEPYRPPGHSVAESVMGASTQIHQADLVFENKFHEPDALQTFVQEHLLPPLSHELGQLQRMISCVEDFPRPNDTFQDVLGLCRRSGGLALCVSLLHKHFRGTWSEVKAIVSPESGGWIFAAPLACRTSISFHAIRKGGKLPKASVKVARKASYISDISRRSTSDLEFECADLPLKPNSKVVTIDDVLSTGSTVHAVIRLLASLGIGPDQITVFVVLELPAHRGRELLRLNGLSGVAVQSLLVSSGF